METNVVESRKWSTVYVSDFVVGNQEMLLEVDKVSFWAAYKMKINFFLKRHKEAFKSEFWQLKYKNDKKNIKK